MCKLILYSLVSYFQGSTTSFCFIFWLCLNRAVGKTEFQLVMALPLPQFIFVLFVTRFSPAPELTGSVAEKEEAVDGAGNQRTEGSH
jgi:hypothetical protein